MLNDLVVILTALNLEYEAVHRKLGDPQVTVHKSGTRFEVGTVPGTSCRVALGLTSKGNHSAAVLAERAIEHFSPAAVLFVGVAGRMRSSIALGDVVMATYVYAYHGATSEDDGLKARPRVWEAPHPIIQLGQHLARMTDRAGHAPENGGVPRVHFGPIAAGEVLQNSANSAEAAWLRQHYNDAFAIDMEAAGVAQAGHLSGLPVGVIRGISDRADGTKNGAEDRERQPRAAANAAAFAVRLAAELIKEAELAVEAEEEERTIMAQKDRTGRGSGSVVNTAFSSTVGIMAGEVTGSTVHVSGATPKASTPTELVAELDRFREHLTRHHADGTLDADIHHEAQVELSIARRAAEKCTANAPAPPKKAAMALRKLRGLLDNHPELAAGLAALSAAAGDPA
ncbi:5'-methylthioadenosine/S-adenosylhomocysteine nucleosidase [Streptomyces sp. NBS 14/10]|uniref:5'-methylthioadenosine/S-adenosylhomocysteine nucleosidase family protein n=1 Tax=Streptomyces sp. NBS 14/10 TaxID=1945643 RepID=UPI000B7D46EA|nr:5'-methylthioadenosine/S-adenosylhomocysteine nucleosidase [Streptomyces sp. NBS 14/10]KAK1179748.1 5'-methylthioadenosine/S-adenosylhomocysteine nucleosidase [Streptomyces sp. NBS 14/10]